MPTTRSANQSHPSPAKTPKIKREQLIEPPKPKVWDPARFLSYEEYTSKPGSSYAVVILNQPIENVNLFIQICSRALYIVCADGGANRVYDLDLSEKDEKYCKIDAICGDLDSLRPDVQQHYRDKGATISKDPDQYATDFTKCLKHLNSIAEPSKKRKATGSRLDTVVSFDVAVIGGLGGRADQAFSQLHHLYTASVGVGNRYKDVYLITPESIIFLLLEGLNIIRTPVESDLLGEAIGIIPIAKSSVITARGLEWDVEDWQTEFGTQISTSNHIRDSHVEVETSEKVLFTVEIARKPEQTDETRSAKRRRLESEEDDREATVLVKGITESIGKITERLNGPAPSVLISNVASKLDGLATCIQNNSEGMQKTMERMFNVIQMMADIIDKKVNTTRVEKVESLVRENIKITSDLDLSVIMNQKDNKIQGQEMISALKLVAGKIRDAEWKPTIMDASLSDEELNSS